MVEIHLGAEPAEINELVANMRVQDRRECLAASVTDIHAAIVDGVANSLLCWTGKVDGKVACIFGVRPVTFLGEQGIPWMLGTEILARNARTFIRHSRLYIGSMLRAYPHLMNFVHAPNRQAIGWLTRMGFVLGEQVLAPSGEPFYPFEMKAGDQNL